MRALPYEAKKLACQQNPQRADQLVELMEGYQAAQGVLRSGRPGNKEAPTCQINMEAPTRPKKRQPEEVPSSKPSMDAPWRRPLINPDHRRCYEVGHITWNCPQRGDVHMSTAASGNPTGRPCGLLTTCWAEEEGASPSTPVTANGRDAIALLDW